MALNEGQLTAERHHRDVPAAGARATPLRQPRERGPMLVEFIGIPGSGKSTLCSAVISELRRDNFTIITRQDYFAWMQQPLRKRLFAVVGNGSRTWLFVFHVILLALRHRHRLSTCYHLTCMHVWLSRVVSCTSPSSILLDEFVLHRLTNRLRYRSFANPVGFRLDRALTLFYPSCDIHWVIKTIPVELALQRISNRHVQEKRSPWFVERLSTDRQQVLLNNQAELYRSISRLIQSRYGDKVHHVDGARPLLEQVRHIKGIMTESMSEEALAAPAFDTSLST